MKQVSILLVLAVLLLPALAAAKTVTLPVTQAWQHKDTSMNCVPGGSAAPHLWDHAVNPPPGCGHCGYYCAPASISMYATFRGITGAKAQQDDIYDNGKFTQGEILGDGIIQTHGVGMYDGVSPMGVGGAEVQTAFQWSLGALYTWGVNVGGAPMTDAYIQLSIDDWTPILWCDHYGYPAEINPPLPDDAFEVNGHAKIIAGYNDKDTATYADDEYLIYDPWPASGSPYWVPTGTVLDVRDVYMADIDVVPNEETSWGSVKALYR